MAESLRESSLLARGVNIPSSLYIVGDSHAFGLDIPHLPTLGAMKCIPGVPNYQLNDLDTDNFQGQQIADLFPGGDIVWFDGTHNTFRSILSSRANSNTLLVTEQCDNRCLFCSQPPNELSDIELYQKATLSILNYNQTGVIGISGGEPTLNRFGFITMLNMLSSHEIANPLHILTNGRGLANQSLLSELRFPVTNLDILWGIPLYGFTGKLHDALVKADGAFVETLQGILNLAALGQSVELRIIPVRDNLDSLAALVEFVISNFPNIESIAVMNLEPKGWARNNFDSLYVKVENQVEVLVEMVSIAQRRKQAISLFNYPLCLLPDSLRPFACQSISDWKNYYPKICNECDLKSKCGGFFASSSGKFLEIVEPLKWKN